MESGFRLRIIFNLKGDGFCGGGEEAFEFFSIPVNAGVHFFRQERGVFKQIQPIEGFRAFLQGNVNFGKEILLLMAHSASARLAPMPVPLLSSCFESTNSFLSLHKNWYKRTIRTANFLLFTLVIPSITKLSTLNSQPFIKCPVP